MSVAIDHDDAMIWFPSDSLPDAGLVTLTSPHDFAATKQRILNAINPQSDTVILGTVDLSERSKEYGIVLRPLRLVLLAASGPGGKTMGSAPTLGLDAYCQTPVIRQDEGGAVHATINNLLTVADRKEVSGGLTLRFINRRSRATFSTALGQGDRTVAGSWG